MNEAKENPVVTVDALPDPRKLAIVLEHDHDCTEPGSEWRESGGDWTVTSFNVRHRNNEDKDTYIEQADDAGSDLHRQLKEGLAFWLRYSEHSLCKWDTSAEQSNPQHVDGVIVWMGDESNLGVDNYDKRQKSAKAFLETYTEWCNGNCYFFAILDDQGKDRDSCGGLIGMDHLADVLNDFLKPGDVVAFAVECADVASYLKLKDGIENRGVARKKTRYSVPDEKR